MDFIVCAGAAIWLTVVAFKIFSYPIIKEGGGIFDYTPMTWGMSLANFFDTYSLRYEGYDTLFGAVLIGGVFLGIFLWIVYFFVGVINANSPVQEKKDYAVIITIIICFLLIFLQ